MPASSKLATITDSSKARLKTELPDTHTQFIHLYACGHAPTRWLYGASDVSSERQPADRKMQKNERP